MIDQLRLLVQLQGIDKTIYDLEQEQQTIPGRLAELNLREKELASQQEEAQAQFDQVAARRQDLEKAAEEMRHIIKRAENRLMAAKGQRDYQAANAEIEENRDRLKQTDDLLVEVMEQQDAAEGKLNAIKAQAEELANQSAEQKATLTKRHQDVEAELKRLRAKRGKMTKEVEASVLDEYEFILSRRDGIAVAGVSNGSCQVCRMALPPQMFNELQRMDRIMPCPSCRRMMYWADAEAFQDLL